VEPRLLLEQVNDDIEREVIRRTSNKADRKPVKPPVIIPFTRKQDSLGEGAKIEKIRLTINKLRKLQNTYEEKRKNLEFKLKKESQEVIENKKNISVNGVNGLLIHAFEKQNKFGRFVPGSGFTATLSKKDSFKFEQMKLDVLKYNKEVKNLRKDISLMQYQRNQAVRNIKKLNRQIKILLDIN